MMDEWPNGAFGQFQCRESDGQVETPWPGASRIKIEHTVNNLDPRPMRVAGNDHVNSAGYGIHLQFIDIVEDVDRAPAEPYHLGVGITFCPVSSIDIPSDRNHGCNLAESGDDVGPTDVAGVDDMLHPGQALLSLCT